MDLDISMLIKAKELDKNLKTSFSYIEEWAAKNIKIDQIDQNQNKNGEFTNGNFYPSKNALINSRYN